MKDQAREFCEPAKTSADMFGPWSCSMHAPGAIAHPDQLDSATNAWLPTTVPTTVASMLEANGQWSFDEPGDIDAHDWWFRTTFARPEHYDDLNLAPPCWLCFEGLATLCEVWLNGERVLTTDNMFRSYRLDISAHLRNENELVLGFRSLNEALKTKRPRPRWKTNLVAQQQLRWHRTSLLGRIPGWAPVAPAVGPWRDVRLETSPMSVHDRRLTTRLDGSTGVVSFAAMLQSTATPREAWIEVGGHRHPLELREHGGHWLVSGEARVEGAPLWWPHTHGTPHRLPCEIIIEAESPDGIAVEYVVHCSQVGFRKLEVPSERFVLRVNGEAIYCRGACWTTNDLLSLVGNEASLRRDLILARDAGVNLLRVGGTMTYETTRFYELCDDLGIMVWQDFMFANMDYPVEDEAFLANITAEAREQVTRLAAHPSVVAYCGNSEIEQQASMLGMSRELWSNRWFGEQLPAIIAELHTNTAYLPSTPTGGVLPFQAREGVTHFYGVGAYLRPVGELRSAGVRFTSECLGFSNVPEPSTVHEVFGGANPAAHDPRWKRRVPRDTGPGWDFEDVRNHYLRELYSVDPATLRSFHMSRYLQLGRTVTGEMMSQTFAEWRSTHSTNQGGLVWFYKDLWPGAGWGVVDSTGLPKAAYYYLKRAWRPRQLTITDEVVNGLDLHLTNETADDIAGSLEVTLLKEPNVIVARQEVELHVSARSKTRRTVDEILGRFYDCNYVYRFGPPQHDVVIATWYDSQRNFISEAFHLIHRRDVPQSTHVKLDATATRVDDAMVQLTLTSNEFLHAVRFDIDGWLPDDNYFHLPPARTKTITFRPFDATPKSFRGTVEALNFEAGIAISASEAAASTRSG